MTGTVYVRTVPHPIPKEHGVTQSLGRSKINGVKATVTGGKMDGHLQLRHWCRAQPSSTNLGCEFSGSWSEMRTLLHCTGLSTFWFHKLSSEHVSHSLPLLQAPAVFMFMLSSGSLGRPEQSQHVYSSAMAPRKSRAGRHLPSSPYSSFRRGHCLPMCAFILLFPPTLRLRPSTLKCPQVCF